MVISREEVAGNNRPARSAIAQGINNNHGGVKETTEELAAGHHAELFPDIIQSGNATRVANTFSARAKEILIFDALPLLDVKTPGATEVTPVAVVHVSRGGRRDAATGLGEHVLIGHVNHNDSWRGRCHVRPGLFPSLRTRVTRTARCPWQHFHH